MNEYLSLSQSNSQVPSMWYAHAMEQLVQVVQELSLARHLDTVMDIVRHAARNLTGADGATFVMRENNHCFYAEEDAISPLWKGQRFPLNACISGWAMINRQSVVIEDIYTDSRIPAEVYQPTFVRSLVMVPIRTLDPIGAIGNYWANLFSPTQEQIKILQALADVTAIALENIHFYEDLENRVQKRTIELQSILDNVQVGVIFAIGNRVVRANPKSAEIFGCDSQDTLFHVLLGDLLCPAADGKSLVDSARSQLAKGKVFNSESIIIRQDRKELWVHLIAKSLDPEQHLSGEIWVIKDIHETKVKEKKLNELKIAAELANRAKDSFLATMSHEIRTPLTGMLGMLELLSLTHLNITQQKTLEIAWNSGKSLLRIVSDILDWSKIEEGKLELSPSPTSVWHLLQEVVNTYSHTASAKDLILWQHVDERISASHIVDPLRLSQVLNNFISNAIKFTQRGEIVLSAELVDKKDSNERIRFSVKDTGIGISKAVQQKLFQRYRQENADTARMYGGTGLGLAICRHLAELMDGQIELRSEPGLGSIFSLILTLPVCEASGEIVQLKNLESPQNRILPLIDADVDKPVVLIVDDHPVNRELLARQINILGLHAETAENGSKAVLMWQEKHYAMIITDCHMPEMDGYALTKAIREIETEKHLPHIPIIAWTANALAEEAEYCHSLSINELLLKPTDLTQLRAVLTKYFSLSGTEKPGTKLVAQETMVRASDIINFDELSKVAPDFATQFMILHDFHAHLRANYDNLTEMMESKDILSVEGIAHRMHGSSLMVGSKALATACASVERAARKKDLAEIAAAMPPLQDGIKQIENLMSSLEARKKGEN